MQGTGYTGDGTMIQTANNGVIPEMNMSRKFYHSLAGEIKTGNNAMGSWGEVTRGS